MKYRQDEKSIPIYNGDISSHQKKIRVDQYLLMANNVIRRFDNNYSACVGIYKAIGGKVPKLRKDVENSHQTVLGF